MSSTEALELVSSGGEVNLDYAATTPALRASVDAVLEALPQYGSVHRGGGSRSRLTTEAYERARASVARFVDADDDYVVVFVRNSTEAINLAAASLEPGARVLCSPFEHHANLLPWRGHDVEQVPFAHSPGELVNAVAASSFDLLAVCGASNVTGDVFPLRELADAARARGARILVDAAQLAPHRPISVRELDVDFLALSGHKLYAPFGSGVLVARRDALADVPPLLKGGGAVRVVTLDDVSWADVPHRLEAGTPNVLGAIALAAACDALAAVGMESIARGESAVARRLWDGLESVRGCTVLRAWPAHDDRVGVASFTLDGWESRALAERLAAEHGIAVRAGLFCAHPFVAHLLGADLEPGADPSSLPAAVRASIGVGVGHRDVDRLIDALTSIAAPRARRRLHVAPRVDVHRHLWPDELVAVLRARTEPPSLAGSVLSTDEGVFEIDIDAHSAERCLQDLDRDGLDVAVVSLQPTLGAARLPEPEADEMYGAYNDGVASVVAAAGGRIRAFAAGGVRDDVAGLCVEAGELLHLSKLAATLDALAARGQTLFVHPGPAQPPPGAPDWWGAAVDYTAQMQSAYAAWLAAGIERWPELHVVFAILAGGAPFQLERLRSRGVDTRRATRANVQFDTASYGRLSLELCLAAYGVDRLVYGSDAPVIDGRATLADVNALGKATADAICRHNPASLLAA